MTDRDHFAAKAMAAIISHNYIEALKLDVNWDNQNNNFGKIAKCAYKIADAMISEKLKKTSVT